MYLNDDNKLQKKYSNRKAHAKEQNIPFDLTYEQYCSLVQEANIVSSQLGRTGKGYDLARYGDQGGYTYGNCRFITHAENMREQKTSEAQRQASRQNLQNYHASGNTYNHWIQQRIHEAHNSGPWFSPMELFQYNIWRHVQSQMRQAHYRLFGNHPENPNAIPIGNPNNSQYGTHWITDGFQNAKIQHGQPLPPGWKFGRVC